MDNHLRYTPTIQPKTIAEDNEILDNLQSLVSILTARGDFHYSQFTGFVVYGIDYSITPNPEPEEFHAAQSAISHRSGVVGETIDRPGDFQLDITRDSKHLLPGGAVNLDTIGQDIPS